MNVEANKLCERVTKISQKLTKFFASTLHFFSPEARSIMNQFQFTITIPNDRGDLIGPEGILLDPNFVQIGFLEIVNCNCKL